MHEGATSFKNIAHFISMDTKALLADFFYKIYMKREMC